MTLRPDLLPAAELLAAGRPREAEEAGLRLLEEGWGADARLHHLLGLARQAQGRPAEALEAAEAALARGGGGVDLLRLRAELLSALDRKADAAGAFAAVLEAAPGDVAARLQKALLLAADGRDEEALADYEALVSLGGGPKILNNQGVSLERLGRLEEALEAYAESLRREPNYVAALHNRGSALTKLGRLEEAAESFAAALALQPDQKESWNFRGVALEKLGRSAEALLCFERAIGVDPAFADAWSNRSASLRALGRLEDARKSAEEALRARPGFPEALNALGSALTRLRRFEEALAAFRRALSAEPENPAFLLNYGMALELSGDLEAAASVLEEAEARDPGAPEPAYARGLVDIRRGRLLEGLRRFEVRWSQANGPTLRYPADSLWLGERSPKGLDILVHAEQGFGDVLQFCRFVPDLLDQGARVVLEAQPALTRVLGSLDPRLEVRPFAEPPPAFDRHAPVMSLPLALGVDLKDLADRPSPYLKAPPDRVAAWGERLGPRRRLRVGLAWSGNPRHDNDAERSLALSALEPFFDLDADLVSLQAAHRPRDAVLLEKGPLLHFETELTDFAETAALIAQCDLVLAVDTAVAHLAGALGARLLVLLPNPCDFRWMDGRPDTPWYPTAELLRQDRPLDWEGPLAAARARIKGLGG